MAFWKKSEDPWDIDPEKRKKQTPAPDLYDRDWGREEPEEQSGLLDAVREQWTTRRQEKRAALCLPPEPCPWCGKDMEQGFLTGAKGISWWRGVPDAKARWLGTGRANTMRVDVEGVLATYKTTWYCPACEKMMFDASDLQTRLEEYSASSQNGGWDGNPVCPPSPEEIGEDV